MFSFDSLGVLEFFAKDEKNRKINRILARQYTELVSFVVHRLAYGTPTYDRWAPPLSIKAS